MGTAAAVAGMLVAAVPVSAQSGPAPEEYVEKLVKAGRSQYKARQLVVYMGRPQSNAIVEVHSSDAGRFVRAETGPHVTRVWRGPDHGLVSGRGTSFEDLAPPSVEIESAPMMRKYEVRVGEPARLVDARVVPLELVRRTDKRLVERLWLQPDTGMVHRRELFDPRGRTIGMTTVLDVQYGPPPSPEPLKHGKASPDKVTPVRSSKAPKTLAYGYDLVRSYRMSAKGRPTDHWVYSDGLHTLSVFRRTGTLRRPDDYKPVRLGKARGWAGPGPGTWTWEGDKSVWVVVAEEPQLDPSELTKPLPKGGPSRMARMGSWWSSGLRWVGDKLP
ncbi:MAG TPA: hypothetical protein VNE62_07835 [Actinomycetota bacterium]|nr:hypothetical protein [Actinomycetota bacterium]